MTTSEPAAETRCAEMTRTSRGYELCHRDRHDPSEPHHVRDRQWSSGPHPLARFGQPCGELCQWPDQVVPYLGKSGR